ncbi:speckle targeted PIP5K1A-regulated poly(A) polymerase isoform X2 [Hetaerina americana]|uniref:speckle targeted PIP5K1A-regulated poly(A) polymerase isoform X2 n=1 Tax=Hetaerina americana TaxID=62018 RepID=UPI003A7F5228
MSGEKGIFIRGFHRVTKNELKELFEEFGDIEEIILNKWQTYAIIEFKERISADHVLSQEIFLKGQKLKIVRRKPQYPRQKEVKPVTNHPKDKAAKTSEKDEIGSLAATFSFNSFDSQIMKFVQEMEAIDIKRKVEILCISLQKAMRPCFPGCKIISFGSSVTGLASKESDVDIYIDIGEWHQNRMYLIQVEVRLWSEVLE